MQENSIHCLEMPTYLTLATFPSQSVIPQSGFTLSIRGVLTKMADSQSFGQTRLRDVGVWFQNNRRGIFGAFSRSVEAYRAKFVTCKNARMTPFIHCAFALMIINYTIDYPHLKGWYLWERFRDSKPTLFFPSAHERRREYH